MIEEDRLMVTINDDGQRQARLREYASRRIDEEKARYVGREMTAEEVGRAFGRVLHDVIERAYQ